MEIKKTSNYSMFKLLANNRNGGIDIKHARRIADSIEARNMLEFKPIECTSRMEVIDGQHRLEAAKMLGVDIYYVVNPELKVGDMITLNISKSWGLADFLNFYVQERNQEYIKFQEFIKKNSLETRVGLRLMKGSGSEIYQDFKHGRFTYDDKEVQETFDMCWQTIDLIKKYNGASSASYTKSSKFWLALTQMFKHIDFNAEKWFNNLPRMIERFFVRACAKDYLRLFMEVHNWHNMKKIDLLNEAY